MDDTKKWWQSSGVWGSVIAIAASGAGIAGYVISPSDQQAAIDLATQTSHLVTEAITLGGAAVALWGRLRASKIIS